jgi:hypothetical protein
MTTLNEPVAKRIAKLFRLLSSDFDGEALAALSKMKQLFATEGLSFNDLAVVIESCNGEIEERKYSDADAKVIFERGVEKGRTEAGQKDLEFFDAGGEPRWYDMAVFLQQHVDRLRPGFEKEFATDIAAKMLDYTPSPKQARIILKLFVKLGGVCDAKIKARFF